MIIFFFFSLLKVCFCAKKLKAQKIKEWNLHSVVNWCQHGNRKALGSSSGLSSLFLPFISKYCIISCVEISGSHLVTTRIICFKTITCAKALILLFSLYRRR